ncbi:MAG: ATP-dependent Clp protease adaptor ClpS [Defluviitaleaceae bacterium]|nr:ATP-dependent Clp protease adaptor ClpS [Defluviitaleaceae bacterium]
MNPYAQDLLENDVKLRPPSMFEVIIHNDHVTTMDFVTEILTQIFHKTPLDAAALMMEVHELGHGVAGVYVFDIAVTKKSQADLRASERGFPLKLTIREEPQV